MESFKIAVGSEMKRIASIPKSYAEMISLINKSFQNEILPSRYLVKYQDSEGDYVIVSSEEDFKILRESTGKQLKVQITPPDASLIEILDTSVVEPLLPLPSQKSPREKQSSEPSKVQQNEPGQEEALLSQFQDTLMELRNRRTELRNQILSLKDSIERFKLLEKQGEDSEELFKLEQKLQGDRLEMQRIRSKIVAVRKQILAMNTKQGRRQIRPPAKAAQINKETTSQAKVSELLQKLKITPEMIEEKVMTTVKGLMPLIHRRVCQDLLRSALATEKKEQKAKAKSPPRDPLEEIHMHVTCDGCGMTPLRGIRYKCSACANFDFCSECSNTKVHPHSFIRFTSVATESPKVGRVRGIQADLKNIELQATQTNKTNVGGMASEPKPTTVEVRKIDQQYAAESKQANILPKRVTTTAGNVWVTVDIRNSGVSRWPKSVMLYHQSGLESKDKIEFPFETRSGESSRIVIMFDCPTTAGNYQSKWRLGFFDESTKNATYFGQEVAIEFTVYEDSQKVFEPMASNDAIQQASKLQEVFPNIDFMELVKKVKSNEGKTLEELIDMIMK